MKKSLLLTLTYLMGLWTSPASAAMPAMPPETQKLFQDFRNVIPQCLDRIWPGYSWKGTEVVAVQTDQEYAWKWNVDKDAIAPIRTKSLPPERLQSKYWNGYSDSIPTLYLVNDSKYGYFIGTHEFFHFLVQKQQNWKRNETGLRGTVYPISAQPRIYRRLLFHDLQQYFLTSDQAPLHRAKYWFEKWAREFPEEVESSMDLLEGTARYVDVMAESLLYVGCDASEGELKEDLKDLVENYFVSANHFKLFSLDSEYHLGAIAALILRFEDFAPNWQNLAKEGISPLEVLMDSVSQSQAIAVPDNLKRDYEGLARFKQSDLQKKFSQDLSNWNQKNQVRITFDPELLGTYAVSGMIIPREIPGVSLLSLARPAGIKTRSIDLTFSPGKVIFTDGDSGNPCGVKFATLARESDVKEHSQNRFEIRDMKLRGQALAERKVDASGFTWLCLRAE